jgi:hypothetical protein
VLHEATIMNRKATFDTLDQLKQRLLPRRPMARQLQNTSTDFSTSHLLSMTGTSTFDPSSPIKDNHMAPVVTIPSKGDTKASKHGLSSIMREKKRSSGSPQSSATAQSQQSKGHDDINLSQAIQYLLNTRGTNDPTALMQDIQEIMDSYQGHQISPRSSDPCANMPAGYGYDGRRDTLTMLNAGDPYSREPTSPTRESLHISNVLPPTPEERETGSYPRHPVFNKNIFNQQPEHSAHQQQYAAPNPYPQMQTQGSQSHDSWSRTSSNYSESPSLDRNSSTSSQESRTQNQPPPLNHSPRTMSSSIPRNLAHPSSPSASTQYHDYQTPVQPQSSGPYASISGRYSQPIAPSSPQQPRVHSGATPYMSPQTQLPTNPANSPHENVNSLMYSPYATPYQQPRPHSFAPFTHTQQQPYPIQRQDPETSTEHRSSYPMMTPVSRDTSSTHSTQSTISERTVIQSGVNTATVSTPPTTTAARHLSFTPSIASTDSSGSGSIRILSGLRAKPISVNTIQSGPPNQERMMDGRPCRANNYWGFCKGAWTIREDAKKGLALRCQPLGMYNSKEIWECTECTFKGSMFSTPHPTKKNKDIKAFDPRIITSASQIRYKWLFLAKSHIKKKASESHSDESNYGCVFCSLEDRVSSVYGGVETLMNHIAMNHVADMSESMRRKARCVVGRMPGPGETEWDINIPVFARVEELA